MVWVRVRVCARVCFGVGFWVRASVSSGLGILLGSGWG